LNISDQIILILEKADKPFSLSDLSNLLNTSKATVNVQLSLLKSKGMVNNPEKGLWVFRS
jgi:Mn-dependent DtxR family transcriptional regulator